MEHQKQCIAPALMLFWLGREFKQREEWMALIYLMAPKFHHSALMGPWFLVILLVILSVSDTEGVKFISLWCEIVSIKSWVHASEEKNGDAKDFISVLYSDTRSIITMRSTELFPDFQWTWNRKPESLATIYTWHYPSSKIELMEKQLLPCH